jgi:formylglycine-generating enzyme required for sulfatase activity
MAGDAGHQLDSAMVVTRDILRASKPKRPPSADSRTVVGLVQRLRQSGRADLVDDLVTNGLLSGSRERYAEHVAPLMRPLEPVRFEMGTPSLRQRHFCGESPAHPVRLSTFSITQTPVTNRLMALFDPARFDVSHSEGNKPAVGVSWFDAALFAMWMGCRLPTEAEWEYACGAGSDLEWCCEESQLAKYAWYSQNSGGLLATVGSLLPNRLGLYDLHGSVWEWCEDSYDELFYAAAPTVDPVNAGALTADKVCRGGSVHALAEMCRSRYRFHEPPSMTAADLGFRLACEIR